MSHAGRKMLKGPIEDCPIVSFSVTGSLQACMLVWMQPGVRV